MYNSIVIAGPTAVGKTELSIKLAKKLNAKIISADASQVYKELDIGTAKITEDEKDNIKHYLIDIVYPSEKYSVGKYFEDANKILNKDDNIYLLVGGTGLYIQAITDGLTIMPEIDEERRKYLESLDLDTLLSLLKNKENIDINNKRRVIRAIEKNGIEYENVKKNNRKFLKIFLTRNREKIYERINQRVDIMIEQGLEQEAKKIYEKYGKVVSSIGYKELFEYFENKISLEQAIDEIKKASRRYAKRQITWFKNKDYHIYNLDEKSIDDVVNEIIGEFENGR